MGRRFLLDTHVVIDIGNAGKFHSLPAKVRTILEDPQVELLISVVSEVEIAIKTSLGKLSMSKEELEMICTHAGIASYPLQRTHASRLFALLRHHNDPFDRMIIATALSDGIPVITSDREFRKYKGLQVIWK